MNKGDKIVMIGAGNMATRLSVALAEKGYCIAQVYSRTIASARTLATLLGKATAYTDNIADVYPDAQLYIFSVSDSALPHVIESMKPNNGLWVHTAGSMPMDIFAPKCARYGVLYPMQTVSRNKDIDWSEVPIFVEAAHEEDSNYIHAIASNLSQRVTRCNSEQRQALHIAAVYACNFTNHMYAIAEKLLREKGLDFDAMKLLIRETERKAEQMSPAECQTGPAVRCDYNVIEKHLAQLGDSHEAEIYRTLSENIMRYK